MVKHWTFGVQLFRKKTIDGVLDRTTKRKLNGIDPNKNFSS